MIGDSVILSTESSAYFARLLSEKLPLNYLGTQYRKFGDGERYYKLPIEYRTELFNKSVVFVASTNTDKDLLELHRIGCTLARLGTLRRVFVIPFLGYSTMERDKLPGEVVTAKANALLLSSIPNSGLGNIFLMLDLHASGLVHYFEGPCIRHELYAEKVLMDAISRPAEKVLMDAISRPFIKNSWFMFASADLGRTLWVDTFAKKFGTDVAFIRKARDFETSKVLNVIGNVDSHVVIIYDDMTRSADTIIHAAEAYIAKGAVKVIAILSHLALNNVSVIKRLHDSPIEWIITTNSHPMSQSEHLSNKFVITDVSGVFADMIRQILDL